MINALDAVLDKVKKTVERNTLEGSATFAFKPPQQNVVYIKDKKPVKKSEAQQEELPNTVNVPRCANVIMETKSKGGIYNDGVVESLDDDGPIINVPYFGDAGAIINGQHVKLGTVFTPYFLKLYFSSLILWSEQGRNGNGSFVLKNGVTDILDLMRIKKETYQSGPSGRLVSRYKDKDIKRVKATLLRMMGITIRKFRNEEVGHGDGLIDFDPKKIDEKKLKLMHARLVADQLSANFFQIPKTAMNLPKEDIPYAIGINYMIRSMIVSHCIRGKDIVAPINDWLIACGQNVSIGRKKFNAETYYAKETDGLSRIAAAIDVGNVTSVGDENGIQLKIVPSDNTVCWYQPLIDLASSKQSK